MKQRLESGLGLIVGQPRRNEVFSAISGEHLVLE
jgi:hypothetical protein